MEKFSSHTGIAMPLRRSGTPMPEWVLNLSMSEVLLTGRPAS